MSQIEEPTARSALEWVRALSPADVTDGEARAAVGETQEWAERLLADAERMRDLERWEARGLHVARILIAGIKLAADPEFFSGALGTWRPAKPAESGAAGPPPEPVFRNVDAEVDVLERHAERTGDVPGLEFMRAMRDDIQAMDALAAHANAEEERAVAAGDLPPSERRHWRGVAVEMVFEQVSPEVKRADGSGRHADAALNVFLLMVAAHTNAVVGEVDAASLAKLLATTLDWEVEWVADSRRSMRQRFRELWEKPDLYRERAKLIADGMGLPVRFPHEE